MIPIDEFTTAYIECALWSSTDDNEDPLDKNFDIDNIDPESIIRMDQDCKVFQRIARKWLTKAEEKHHDKSSQGHDFWLTRNGHGTGFWDRELNDVGDELTKICKQFGEINLMTGDLSKATLHYE